MDLSPETMAGLVMDAIKEDRTEIRAIRQRIYATIAQLAIASFAITAYLLGKEGGDALSSLAARWWLPLVDLSFLIVLWALFLRAKRDLDVAHLSMEARENVLRRLGEPDTVLEIYPFVDLSAKPNIREDDLYWVAFWVTIPLIAKLILVCLVIF